MKKDIHPKYHQVTFECACGATFIAGSTIEGDVFKTEICSNCHPFYTGKQKLVDSSGRVEKFKAKMEKVKAAQAAGSKKVKKVPTEGLEEEEETNATSEEKVEKNTEEKTKVDSTEENTDSEAEVAEKTEESTEKAEDSNEDKGEEEVKDAA